MENDTLDETEVQIAMNAIGYEIFGFDRPTHIVNGVPQISITDEERARVRCAAENALRHVAQHRRGV